VDSEYGVLRDVLLGPIEHFRWQAGNAVAQRAERIGLRFDFAVARRQTPTGRPASRSTRWPPIPACRTRSSPATAAS
jgi:hypothetical protein